MMALIRMACFHLREFARVGFFATLLVTSTISVLALQALGSRATPDPAGDGDIWLRSAQVGMWTTCTVAAGFLGFQRFQGTLVHLLFTPRRPAATLLPMIADGSLFGLLASPLAACLAALLGLPIDAASPAAIALGIPALWLACLSLCTIISPLFVLTPNAIAYEGLLAAPIVLLSGVFGYPNDTLAYIGWLLPTAHGIAVLNGGGLWHLAAGLTLSGLFAALGCLLLRRADDKATRAGSLEII